MAGFSYNILQQQPLLNSSMYLLHYSRRSVDSAKLNTCRGERQSSHFKPTSTVAFMRPSMEAASHLLYMVFHDYKTITTWLHNFVPAPMNQTGVC